MLSVLITIPSLILLWVMVYQFFINDEKQREEFTELFLLETPIVRIFYAVVCISVLVWVVSFFFPIGAVVSTLQVTENFVGILWLLQALFAGKVSIWVDILKSKLTSKK
jgi:hypothetical protein